MVPPGFLALALGTRRVYTPERGSRRGRGWTAAAAAAPGLAYLAGHLLVAAPSFPPIDVTDRIAWLAAVAAALAVSATVLPGRAPFRLAEMALSPCLVMGAMLEPLVSGDRSWSEISAQAAPALAFTGLALLNFWAVVHHAGLENVRAVLVLTTAAATPALFLSGSLVLGLLSLTLFATLGAAWIWERACCSFGSVLLGATVLTALVLEGHYFAELPTAAALALAFAPATCWVKIRRDPRRQGESSGSFVSTPLLLGVLGVAVGCAWFAHRLS